MRLDNEAIKIISSINPEQLQPGLISSPETLSNLVTKITINAYNVSTNYLFFIPDNIAQQCKYLEQFEKSLIRDNFFICRNGNFFIEIHNDLYMLFHTLNSVLNGKCNFTQPHKYIIKLITSLYSNQLQTFLTRNKHKIYFDDNYVSLVSFCYVCSIINLRQFLLQANIKLLSTSIGLEDEWFKIFMDLFQELKFYWFLF